MAKRVGIEVSLAIAEAAKLANVDVVAAYPITPQTHIVESIADLVANGKLDTNYIPVESEHSAMSTCLGASAAGARAFTASASQGLELMHEVLYAVSSMRMPVVMAVANRSLSSPLSIWNDQQDTFSQRDSGWIQLYVENAQEAFDTQIQAYKIAEQLSTPAMVCLDGFVVSHTYEPIKMLEKENVKKFLPVYRPKVALNPSKPVTMGPVGPPEYYMKFKKHCKNGEYTS